MKRHHQKAHHIGRVQATQDILTFLTWLSVPAERAFSIAGHSKPRDHVYYQKTETDLFFSLKQKIKQS